MTRASHRVLVCAAPEGPQRVVLDFQQKTATFEHCHQSRNFLAVGCVARHVCPFTDLHAAHDFLGSDRPGWGFRAVLGLGRVTGVHPGGEKLASMFISTATGRCRAFAHWDGYDELRAALQEICLNSVAGHWSDDPRWMPVYAVVVLAVVGGIIWFLL